MPGRRPTSSSRRRSSAACIIVNVVAVALDAVGVGLSDQAGVLISSLVSGLVSVGARAPFVMRAGFRWTWPGPSREFPSACDGM